VNEPPCFILRGGFHYANQTIESAQRCAMELLPASITFGIFPEDVPKLSLTIGRKGGVRE